MREPRSDDSFITVAGDHVKYPFLLQIAFVIEFSGIAGALGFF